MKSIQTAVAAAAGLIALAAVAPPAGAATASVAGGELRYQGSPGEPNSIEVGARSGSTVNLFEHNFRITPGAGCNVKSGRELICTGVSRIVVDGGDELDDIRINSSLPTQVRGGSGPDLITGHTSGADRTGPVTYSGGTGSDKLTYGNGGVFASIDGVANDGQPPNTRDNVLTDIEHLEGSGFDDRLFGNDGTNALEGGAGRDQLVGNGGNDVFVEATDFDLGDTFFGGAGVDEVIYHGRQETGVRVTIDNRADDGAPFERDNVLTDVENVTGTLFDDVLIGNDGPNGLNGSRGRDTLQALGGDDAVDSLDAFKGDTVQCGAGFDTFRRDAGEKVAECERETTSFPIGKFVLKPGTVSATAGHSAKVKLAWTHPESWEKLDRVDLVLEHRGKVVGTVTVDQETLAIKSGGRALKKVRGGKPVGRGKTVTVALDVNVSRRFAGETLVAKLGARDDVGREQTPQRAGLVRVR